MFVAIFVISGTSFNTEPMAVKFDRGGITMGLVRNGGRRPEDMREIWGAGNGRRRKGGGGKASGKEGSSLGLGITANVFLAMVLRRPPHVFSKHA